VISWRYHLVSIVAVILAVALGVLAGATVVGDRFVEQLQRNTANLEKVAEQRRIEADRLTAALVAAQGYLTQDKLAGRDVVLVTQDPVDEVALRELQDALERQAGARVVALLTVLPKIGDAGSKAQLAGVFGRSPDEPLGRLVGEFARAIAGRLQSGPAARGGTDLLDRVSGFLTVEHPRVDVQDIGGSNTIVVVFAGGTSEPTVPLSLFLLPFVQELAAAPHVAPVAVGESLTSVWGLVGDVRSDTDHIPHGTIVTVDDLDQPYGGLALVMGLADLISTIDGVEGGDYGIHGADGILPAAPTPSPSVAPSVSPAA
jgi:hypothetical protein